MRKLERFAKAAMIQYYYAPITKDARPMIRMKGSHSLVGVISGPLAAARSFRCYAVGVLIFLAFSSCSAGPRYTDDPNASVVKLRVELVAFSKGDLESVTGRTESAEAYVLMYGYEEELDSLPISKTLQKKLKRVAPRPTEMYVLVHVYGDDIQEYTEWDLGHNDNDHPLLWPMPFVIRGSPFKITARERERYKVVMELE